MMKFDIKFARFLLFIGAVCSIGLVVLFKLMGGIDVESADSSSHDESYQLKPRVESRNPRDRRALDSEREKRINKHSLAQRVANLSWGERQSVLREALRSGSETPESVWKVFKDLEIKSKDKIGPSGAAREIFSEMAEINPYYGISCLEELSDGVVRNKALLGFASNIPADAVVPLYESICDSGYGEEVDLFFNYIQDAARTYSSDELNKLLSSEILDEESIGVLRGYLNSRYQDHDSKLNRGAEVGGESFGSLVGDEMKGNSFEVANKLQNGHLGDKVISVDLVKGVAESLVYEDPERAFEWACGWESGIHYNAAIQSVARSWVRLDPNNCSDFISKVSNREARSLGAIEIVRYLVEKNSEEEAREWAGEIIDGNVRGDILSRLK